MCLLTEWEGRTGKYLALGHAARTERYFPVRPDLTQSIGILSYDLIFYDVRKREEGEGLLNK